MYQFYVKLDGQQYGPYTATQIVNMDLPGDTEIMEPSIGTWEPAKDYPWSDLVLKESGAAIGPSGNIVAGNSGSYIPPSPTPTPTPMPNPYPASNPDDEPSIGLNILSFLFPIIGWILYFALNKSEKGKACAKWAWISIAVSIILYILF